MKDKILKTCKDNAFLIFLFVCVCIVAISTISIVTREMDKDKTNEDLVILDNPLDTDSSKLDIGDENVNIDPETGEIYLDYANALDKEAQESPQDIVEGSDDLEEVFYEEEESEDDELEFIDNYVEEPSSPSTNMILPVEGTIITAFAKDNLIYSETLDEWRGHPGIDIKAQVGTKVIAPLAGKVTKVYEDDLWGKTIVIDHGNGLESKYCNLGTLEMVKEGIDVKQGDHIATVGSSAKIEMLMEDHLHFEVIKNQKTVDPRSIIQ